MPQLTIRLPVVTGTDVYLKSLAGRLVSGPATGRRKATPSVLTWAVMITRQLLKRCGAVQDTTHRIRLGRAVTLAEVAFTRDHEPMPFEHWPGCQAGKGSQRW